MIKSKLLVKNSGLPVKEVEHKKEDGTKKTETLPGLPGSMLNKGIQSNDYNQLINRLLIKNHTRLSVVWLCSYVELRGVEP